MISVCKNKLGFLWMLLALVSVAIAGTVSLSVVFLRIPFFSSFFSDPQHYFDLSLVVHVNLSVLIWMCSVCLTLISSFINSYTRFDLYAFALSSLSTILVIFSVFVPDSAVYKSNYVPVIQNALFLIGIALFLISIFAAMYSIVKRVKKSDWSYYAVFSIMITFGCALFAFFTSYFQLKYSNDIGFYESLFWGGGHILQIFFMEVFIFACCLQDKQLFDSLHAKTMSTGYVVASFSAILSVIPYIWHEASHPFIAFFFTKHMIYFGAILPLFVLLAAVKNIKTFVLSILSNTSLLCAFFLCIYGGILGFLTVLGNVTVPAHYHGSVVSITVAFMGFIYFFAGFNKLKSKKFDVCSVQIYLYSFGQFLHITALEWLGGYSALRKVSSLPHGVSVAAKAMFGIGGLLSVIGGFLFCFIVFAKILKQRSCAGKVEFSK